MQKPHGPIWHEKGHYDMGRMHFGRVSMSVAMIMSLWIIPAALMFLGGGIITSAIYQVDGDYAVSSSIATLGLFMLAVAAAVAVVVGVIALVKWIAKDIRIDGPGRD